MSERKSSSDASGPVEKRHALKRVNATIHKIEQRTPPASALQGGTPFTWRMPKYHDAPFEMYCPAGHAFKSFHLDMLDLMRLFNWQNDHAACEQGDA